MANDFIFKEYYKELTPLQEKTVNPSTAQQAVTPDSGYALSKVTVNAVTNSIDSNITATNIRRGVTILGVQGNLDADKPDQNKTVTPTTSQQTVTADTGYELAKVTVNAVTSAIDADIKAENIKKGVNILGVAGTLESSSAITDVATASEMNALLVEANVGKVYRFTGTTDSTYTNGDLYEVSKVQTGVEITINNGWAGSPQFNAYDGNSNSGKVLTVVEGENNVTIESGYVFIEPHGGYFVTAPTVSGDITIEEYTTKYNEALFKVNGPGAINFSIGCFVEGTNILLANGSAKKVEDITYDDNLLVWDFYNAKQATAKPTWVKKKQTASVYYKVTLSDGTVLKLVGSNGKSHRLYNVEQQAFVYPQDFASNEHTINASGELLAITSIEKIEETVNFYNIITDKHYNLYAENILTSCRLSNRYSIKDMRYDTTDVRMTEEEVQAYVDKLQINKKVVK